MITKVKRDRIKFWFDIYIAVIGIITLSLFLIILGYKLNPSQIVLIKSTINFIIITFLLQEIIRFIINLHVKNYFKNHIFEFIIVVLLSLDMSFPGTIMNVIWGINPSLNNIQVTLIYTGILHLLIIITFFIKLLRYSYLLDKIKLHPGAIFALSFLFIIILGTILLLLPNSTPTGKSISLIDSLFTSTSAVCVTGLIVLDTAKDFTFIGQLVILFLIQTGGLGVMTLTTFFAMYLSGGTSFKIKIMMKDLLSQESLAEVRNIILKILLFTFLIESLGALLLYLSMGGSLIEIKWNLLFSSIFHSVSAFCNAGFSIYSAGLMDDTLLNNYSFYTIIMILIVLGGLGFSVLSNLFQLRNRKNNLQKLKYRLTISTKIVLSSTLILIFSGALFVFFAEPYSFNSSMGFFEKIFHSFFLSVTARTAGFNTVPIDLLTNVTIIVLLPLMWIGASPGSTGGGIKTTTISAAFLSLFNLMRGKEKVELFHREIDSDSIKKAFLVILSSLIFLGMGVFVLVWIEPTKQPLDLIFEATSALGTVGLSRNLTSFLGTGGKAVIIILMFVGRIGVLTFFMAFVRNKSELHYSYPKTDIMIG
jgi:potassium uptake TrkH family protein